MIYVELFCHVTGLPRAVCHDDLITLASAGPAADSDLVLRASARPGPAQHHIRLSGRRRMGGLRVHRLHEPDVQHRAVTEGGTVPEPVVHDAHVCARKVRPPHRTVSHRPRCCQ